MFKLVLIVGLAGSGKSTVADFIKKRFKAGIVRTGDIIREEIKRRKMRYTPRNDALIANWFHTGGRERLLVRRAWDKIRKSHKKLVVMDGLRSDQQLNYLTEMARKRPAIIAVVASFDARVKRSMKRGRFGKDDSVKYLMLRDKLENSHGVGRLIRKADYTINNSRLTVRQTEAVAGKIMRKILKK